MYFIKFHRVIGVLTRRYTVLNFKILDISAIMQKAHKENLF